MTHLPLTQSPTLYALIIRLIATQNGRLRATQGHLAHAAFLNTLQQVDPTLSQTLHQKHGRKPFTISPLHGYGHGRKGHLHIKVGQEGWLRVTLLDSVLFQTFISYFLAGTHQPTIQLENISFHISEILSTPHSHPLAGYDSCQALHQRWAEADLQDPACGKIPLHFRTPTAFSLRGPFRHNHVLPDPPLVFGQLAHYWDQLTGSETQERVQQFCAEKVAVARHQIETHIYQYRRSKQVGFTGQVTFEILDKTAVDLIQHLNRLADLAFYTGIGSKTTMGMGQVGRVKL